jgi:hypothetical protein
MEKKKALIGIFLFKKVPLAGVAGDGEVSERRLQDYVDKKI